jgi:hypothetical protein
VWLTSGVPFPPRNGQGFGFSQQNLLVTVQQNLLAEKVK